MGQLEFWTFKEPNKFNVRTITVIEIVLPSLHLKILLLLIFQCDFCDFKTPQRVNYLKHLATKHRKTEEGEELKMSVQCALCNFKCVAGEIHCLFFSL